MHNKIPFVGLHAHSTAGSPFDGLGYPNSHMDFAFENGSDALALTDHGNMNGLAYQVLHSKKMAEDGKIFKPIYGIEAYFIPSIDDWRKEYEQIKAQKAASKKGRRTAEDDGSSGIGIEDEGLSRRNNKKLSRRNHVVLLAQNQIGLSNLFQLTTDSFDPKNFYKYPRMDYEMFKRHNEGIIASSACLGGVYAKDYWANRDEGEARVLAAMRDTTSRMQEIFGDRWFAELQWNNIPEQHELNKYIVQVASDMEVDLISTADSHYPTPASWKDRELYKRLGWIGRKSRPDWLTDEIPVSVEEIGYELYPKNGEQMWDAYRSYSNQLGVEYDDDKIRESIERTYHIAHDRIEDFVPDNSVRLPDFITPPGNTPEQALLRLCVDNMKNMGLVDSEYVDRLKGEISVIEDKGFSKYFLLMKAIADLASSEQISGAGRGSAAGSLIAYVLGITQVDPIKYNLQFSRFLRSDDKGYPDIDYDIGDNWRVKTRLVEKWGADKVVPISNWNTLQLRSLVKDVSKFYNISFQEVNAVTNRMMKEATPKAKAAKGIKAGVYQPTYEEVMQYSDSLKAFLVKYPHVGTHIKEIHGSIKSCSRHAGGVVIAEDLSKHMPIIKSGDVRQTPWTEGLHVKHLEPMGFIKFDILALDTLQMFENAIRQVLIRHEGVEEPTFDDVRDFYDEHLHPDKIDFDDQNVYENIYHAGKWAGVFQFTETGVQNFCKRSQPKNLTDLAAITAIYRPATLGADADKAYLEAKDGTKHVDYSHPIVKEVTEETYGLLIFQEQIAALAHKLGKDISLDEGNVLRKLLVTEYSQARQQGASKNVKKLEKIKKKFFDGCREKEMVEGQIQDLWDKFKLFSGYGFNKSHAISYSMISFQCAWLLNYYQDEWMAAFLDNASDRKKEKAITIVKGFGYEIRSLDVNSSGVVWELSADGKTLIQPLNSVKGLGVAAIAQIVQNRPFKSIEDFLFNESVIYSKLNKKALDVLCRSGALDGLMDKRFTGDKHFWSCVAVDRARKVVKFEENIELYKPEGKFTDSERLENLVSLTGKFPLELVMNDSVVEKLEEYCIPPLGEWDADLGVAWFIPREVILKKTKNNKPYYIVKVIDSSSATTKIKCWGVRPGKDIIHINKPYMAKLDHNEQWGFSARQLWKNFKLLG
tara:strand:- start:29807 stop:33262 length:3456 start_codon:yes stop_codon:yes gene_type:complete